MVNRRCRLDLSVENAVVRPARDGPNLLSRTKPPSTLLFFVVAERHSHLTVRSVAEYRSGEENGCELSISAEDRMQ
jgi:hypothetical protein